MFPASPHRTVYVALRKESVDRNAAGRKSAAAPLVALRKESVDRNVGGQQLVALVKRRSPQGERG